MARRQGRQDLESNQTLIQSQYSFNVRDLRLQKPLLKKIEMNDDVSIKSLETIIKQTLEIDFRPILFYNDRKVETLDEIHSIITKNPSNIETLDVRRYVDLNKLRKLRGKQEVIKTEDYPFGVVIVKDEPFKEVRRRIEDVAINFTHQALTDPLKAGFLIPSRSAENVGYEDELKMVLMGNQLIERIFRNLSSVQSVAQYAEMLRLLYNVLTENIHVTKRDLFYQNVNVFNKDQRVSDGLIEDVGASLQVTRNSLNVIASAKGVVLGKLTFTEKGDFIDCSQGVGGRSITPMLDLVENLQSDAEFVLLIEKDAVFNRLAEDRFWEYLPCIIVTAKGQPDLATRAFIKRLRNELELPILAFMDADPYGLDIMRVYTIGSKAMSLETSELAVTDIRWLGLLPRDLEEYQVPQKL